MTPQEFVERWKSSNLLERQDSQLHFIELCNLLDEPLPKPGEGVESNYCFERSVQKTTGGKGRADVWKRGHFAWEYKGQHKNLDLAFDQLKQYATSLENPPLLIVSDMEQFRIHTNWTNTVSKTYAFSVNDLTDITYRNWLKWAMSDPKKLKPGVTRQEVTEQAAESFAEVAQKMRERGNDPQKVAHFVNRLVFCMFAEDVGLLPNDLFTEILRTALQHPNEFVEMTGDLFGAMAKGGRFGTDIVDWFNGGLFDDDLSMPMEVGEIEATLKAAELDWSEIDPAIMGTLFERGLDPAKRSQLGAHYTDRGKIMQIIEPVIARPLLKEWADARLDIELFLEKSAKARTNRSKGNWRKKAERKLQDHLEMLRSFTVLDPACGSGNFLYLALHKIKDIEQQVQIEAESLGFPRQFPTVGPANVKGIEINPYAAELARVSVWIGEIQWMRQNGFRGAVEPILKPLETIECRDAILNDDGTEPDWPKADVIVGNPPFSGGDLVRGNLGDAYIESLRHLYGERFDGKADFVCHWLDKAQRLVVGREISRAGLVATNSVRDGRSRGVLEEIAKKCVIYDAWADEPWEADNTAVRVSLICFTSREENLPSRLNGNDVGRINPDLTSHSTDLTKAKRLKRNKNVAFKGGGKTGKFEISGEVARQWLGSAGNPNGRPNSDVLKPWQNAQDLAGRSAGKWIVDFGTSLSEQEAAQYEEPFSHVLKEVKPYRLKNRVKQWRDFWWRLGEPRPKMWAKLSSLSRYIATPRHSKHRLFTWFDCRICPDSALVVIARDDDTTFGILHSRFHEAWSLRLCTWLGQGNDPRYTHTTTFETFPFPVGLTPDIPAYSYANDPRATAIAIAVRRLVEKRNNWLNPSDLVKWVDEPVLGYPKRPVARSETAEQTLKGRTLTNLYNANYQWLQDAHAALDAAVAFAYGWPDNISTEEALGELLRMNVENCTE